jgi:hypothetical protein
MGMHITVGDDFLALCDKKVLIRMGVNLNDYMPWVFLNSRKRRPVNRTEMLREL